MSPLNRITWTDEETLKVAHAMAELLEKEPGLSLAKCYSRCKHVLPLGRERPESGLKRTKDFNTLLPLIKARQRELRREREREELEPAPRPLQPHLPKEPETRSVIRWTPEEIELLAENLVEHLIKHPGTTLMVAYTAIIDCLPEDRRRPHMNTMASFERMMPVIKAKFKELTKAPPAPPPEIKWREKVVEHAMTVEDLSDIELQAEINRRQFEPILEELTRRVSDKVGATITKSLLAREKEMINDEGEKLYRMFIVGLNADQQAQIHKEYTGLGSFRFWKDDGTSKMKAGCRWADEVILMTDWISHVHQGMARKYAARTTLCAGHLMNLRELIDESLEESLERVS